MLKILAKNVHTHQDNERTTLNLKPCKFFTVNYQDLSFNFVKCFQ